MIDDERNLGVEKKKRKNIKERGKISIVCKQKLKKGI